MMSDASIQLGETAGIAILNTLQNSELWKLLRLTQLYQKRQVSFWHIFQAKKGRKCLKDRDRVFGTLGLVQGVDSPFDLTIRPHHSTSPFDLTISADALLENLHSNYLKAGDISALMFLSDHETLNYHSSSRGFLLSGAVAFKRRESHKITVLGNRIRLQDVGVDSITKFYSFMQRLLLASAIQEFDQPNELIEKEFESKGQETLTMYHKAMQQAVITWSSISTMIHTIKSHAFVTYWTQSCGPVLAVLMEVPRRYTCIVTPSSYVDEPGEGILVLTVDQRSAEFRKIGVGVSTKIKLRLLDTIKLVG
jgi:hypothetical protein